MTVKEVLLGAAQVLETRGWCQKQYVDKRGCCCMSGAMQFAMGFDPRTDDMWRSDMSRIWLEAIAAVESQMGAMDTVIRWNDQQGRTVEEVLSVLEKAAEAAA